MSATIVRAPHTTSYTLIVNKLLLDLDLSLAARGLLTHMLAYKNDWQFNVNYLTNILKEGKDYIKKLLGELEKCGYIQRQRERRPNGTLGAMLYTIYENPTSNKKEKKETKETKAVKKAVTKGPVKKTEKIEEVKKDDSSVVFDPKKFANGKIPKWARNMVKKE